jgi:hypothetical protein
VIIPLPVERRFPLRGGGSVSWTEARQAYRLYTNLFGTLRTLEQLADEKAWTLAQFQALHAGDHFLAKSLFHWYAAVLIS